MKNLFFVRHGQTEWNSVRRMQGQMNSNLTTLGQHQAHNHGKFLATLGIEHLVSSPLKRTRQTANIIKPYLNLDIQYDDRIMEWDCGEWSGEMWDQLAIKWPEEFKAWRADPYYYRGPKCENYPDMLDRTKPFLDELRKLPHKSIAIVSHGMIGRVMVGALLSLTPEQINSLTQQNDTIIQLTQQEEDYKSCHFISGNGPVPGLPKRLA